MLSNEFVQFHNNCIGRNDCCAALILVDCLIVAVFGIGGSGGNCLLVTQPQRNNRRKYLIIMVKMKN